MADMNMQFYIDHQGAGEVIFYCCCSISISHKVMNAAFAMHVFVCELISLCLLLGTKPKAPQWDIMAKRTAEPGRTASAPMQQDEVHELD